MKEVVQKIKSVEFLKQIQQRAYDDIIKSGQYSYQTFVKFIDKKVDVLVISHNTKKVEAAPRNSCKTIKKHIALKKEDFMRYPIETIIWMLQTYYIKSKCYATLLLERCIKPTLHYVYNKCIGR